MITFKIAGKTTLIPTTWADVTYSQYVYMIIPRTFTEYIHLFSGVPLETLNKAQVKNVDKLGLALSFLSWPPNLSERTAMVGPFALPGKPQFESLGQFEDLRNLIKEYPHKERKDFDYADFEKECEVYLQSCAIYFQKARDGEYNAAKVKEVADQLRGASAVEVLSNGSFFFAKALNLSTPSTMLYQRVTRAMKKYLQAFPGYQKTLAFLQRYIGYQER